MKLTQVLWNKNRPYILHPGSSKKRYGKIIVCANCGEECFIKIEQFRNKSWGKFCSSKCRNMGKNNPNFKRGYHKDSHGYIMIKMPEHPQADRQGYVYEHRIVVETKIHRPLKTEEVIHHIDGSKTNNRIENLLLTNNIEHRKIHARS